MGRTLKHEALIRSWQKKVIVISPELVALTGDWYVAGFIRQAIYWQGTKADEEWFWKTNEEWARELMIGLDRFKAIKKQIIQSQFIEVSIRGVPAKTYYRVNFDRLDKEIEDLSSNGPSWWRGHQLDGGGGTNKLVSEAPTNTENTAESTAEKFTYGKQRVPRKAREVQLKHKSTVNEIVDEFDSRQPTPANADECFRKLWGHAKAGRPLVASTHKRMAMLGKTCSLLGPEWPQILAATITRWDDFCGQVSADKGIKTSPAIPSVEFMLKHVDVMPAMLNQAEHFKPAMKVTPPSMGKNE